MDEDELKSFRDKLKITEDRFTALTEYSSEGFAVLSAEGTFLYLTNPAEKMLGFTFEEKKTISLFNLVHPDEFVALTEIVNNVLKIPNLHKNFDTVRLHNQDETWSWYQGTIVNKIDDSSINGLLLTFRDITEQKISNDKLQQLNRVLTFISQINQAISHFFEEESLLKKLCQIAINSAGFKGAWIEMKDMSSGNIKVVAQSGIDKSSIVPLPENHFNYDEVQKNVFQTGHTVVYSFDKDIWDSSSNSYKDAVIDMKSYIVLPLIDMEVVIGTFTLYATDFNLFTEEEIGLLEEATEEISHALDVINRLKNKRKAVQSLQKTKANLEAIVNSASEGFILTDVEGIIMEFNTNAQKSSYSYVNKRLISGASIFDYFPEYRRGDYKKYFEMVLSGETVIIVHSDDRSWEITIAPFFNFNIVEGFCFSYRDITEAAIAETKLLKSELFNKSVLASLADQIAVVEKDGTIVAVNKAWNDFAKLNGTEALSGCSIGSNYLNVCQYAVDSGDYEVKQILHGITSVFDKTSPSFHFEYPCDSPLERRYFILNVMPFGDDDTKVVISHQNITGRKRAEDNLLLTAEKLKTTLSKLSTILDSSLDIICTINSSREFATLNSACQDILGYSPEELIGSKFMNFVYEEDLTISKEAADQVFSGVSIQLFENRYLHKSGRIVPLLWSINYDAKLGLAYCIAKDVTEKKKLEKSVEDERDQFYSMFSQAPSAIGMLKGENHIFEMANPLYLKMIQKDDILGRSVAEVMPEVVDQGFIDILDRVYQSGESYIGTEQLIQVQVDGNSELTDYYINFIYQAYRDINREIKGVFFFINDITEQVTAREKIVKSERFFKGVIENSQDMVATLDASGAVLYTSPAVSKTYGYSLEEIAKLNIFDVIHFDDKYLSTNFIAEVLRLPTTPLSCSALRQRKKDGTYIWVEATLTNFLETNGINAIVVNFRDISERKKAESILRETLDELEAERTRLVTAQKVAKTGSWETNARTFEATWSEETYNILGVDSEDLKASYEAFLNFIHPDDREMLKTNFAQTLIGKGTNSLEHRIITPQGIEKWIDEKWTISMDENGVAIVAIGTCQDITERKQAEQKVLKSEMKLKIAQHVAHVGSWELDIENDEHSWSDEFYQILGISQDIEPSVESFLQRIHLDDKAMVIRNISEISFKHDDSAYHFRFIRESGEIGYALTEWKFEFDSNGNPHHIYGILRDLTEEKKAEDERQKMIIDIMQRNKDLEQFSYIISHNLRSPVANIIGLTEELKDNTHSDETMVILREAISSDVKRLEEVIADLNDIVQTKRDIIERREEVVLSDLVENIALSINHLIENQGVHIKTNFAAIDKIITIRTYMQSIFYNLISNSIKYRRDNSELIIDIATHINGDKLSIIFKDNGIGIDLARNSAHIFGLYKRFHHNTEGKGIGLYMVKTQVETMGGRISVSSKINVGTQFTIEFETLNK